MKSNRKNITLYEAFAGIGSQYKALKNISSEMNWNVKLVGMIEWFIPAIIAHYAIHFLMAIKFCSFGEETNTLSLGG